MLNFKPYKQTEKSNVLTSARVTQIAFPFLEARPHAPGAIRSEAPPTNIDWGDLRLQSGETPVWYRQTESNFSHSEA